MCVCERVCLCVCVFKHTVAPLIPNTNTSSEINEPPFRAIGPRYLYIFSYISINNIISVISYFMIIHQIPLISECLYINLFLRKVKVIFLLRPWYTHIISSIGYGSSGLTGYG